MIRICITKMEPNYELHLFYDGSDLVSIWTVVVIADAFETANSARFFVASRLSHCVMLALLIY